MEYIVSDSWDLPVEYLRLGASLCEVSHGFKAYIRKLRKATLAVLILRVVEHFVYAISDIWSKHPCI